MSWTMHSLKPFLQIKTKIKTSSVGLPLIFHMVSEPLKSIFVLQNKYSKSYLLLIKVSKYNKIHLKIEKINTSC